MKSYIIVPILISVLGLGVILSVGLIQYNNEITTDESEFEGLSNTYTGFISRTILGTIINSGAIMQEIYKLNLDLSRDQHAETSTNTINAFPGVRGLGFIKRVYHADRAAVEAEASAHYGVSLQIKQFNMTRTPVKNYYYPVMVITPYETNENSILLDLNDSPALPGFKKAMITGERAISLGFTLVQNPNHTIGHVIFYPVYDGPSSTEAERIANFVGCTSTVIELPFTVADRLARVLTRNVGFRVVDNRNEQLLVNVCGYKEAMWRLCESTKSGIIQNITVVDATFRVETFKLGDLENPTFFIIFVIGIPALVLIVAFATYALYNQERRVRQGAELINSEKVLSASKQRFIHYVFHEIRVPFQTIKLGLANLKRRITDPVSRSTWIAIDNSIKHAVDILNDMLDVGKMESGKFAVRKEFCDVYSSLELTIEGFRSIITANEITFEAYVNPEIKNKLFKCDLGRLLQCINNFLSNANKFTSFGNIDIVVDIEDRIYGAEAIWSLVVSVSDTGVGIKDADKPKLFNPYVQITNASGEVGTGLGLVIVKNIIEAHGGSISFESLSGKGSTFRFSVPLEVIDKPRDYEKKSIAVTIPEKALDLRVLIVDDNENNCYAFREYLVCSGFNHVDTAYNGIQALARLEESVYDVIFMDYNMPKMSGFECIKKIKQLYPDNASIFMVTGAYLDRSVIDEVGEDHILQKPLDLNKLGEVFDMC